MLQLLLAFAEVSCCKQSQACGPAPASQPAKYTLKAWCSIMHLGLGEHTKKTDMWISSLYHFSMHHVHLYTEIVHITCMFLTLTVEDECMPGTDHWQPEGAALGQSPSESPAGTGSHSPAPPAYGWHSPTPCRELPWPRPVQSQHAP